MTDKVGKDTKHIAVQAWVDKLDADIMGVVSLSEWKGTRLEETVLKLLPQARSVVVMATEIYPEILDLTSPGRTTGEASLNELLDRNADFINGRLTKAAYDVARALHNMGMKALPLPARGCPSDARFLEAVFSYKHAAQAAGLGKIGWHSLLITPGFGPRVRLACCLTEAELEPAAKNDVIIQCDSCGICVDNCPAGALATPAAGEPYVINKFACSSFYNAAGGCAECMRLCPIGR